jgi:site-specific DNA recombinase
VKKIFDLYTNKNWGYSRICQELNRNIDQYPTKKGATWAYSTIKQVLDNPIYVGMIRWGVRKDWAKKRRKGITEDYVLAKGKHQAIINDELWDKTRQKRELVGKTPEKKSNFKYLLSGLAKCPQCGSAMVAQRSTRKNKDGSKVTYRYYSCSKWNSHKGDVCKPNSIKAELLEEQVITNIKTFINSPSVIDKLVKDFGDKKNSSEIQNNIDNISKNIKKLKAKEDKYYTLLVDEIKLKKLKEDIILDKIECISKEIESLEVTLRSYTIQLENINKNKLNVSVKN